MKEHSSSTATSDSQTFPRYSLVRAGAGPGPGEALRGTRLPSWPAADSVDRSSTTGSSTSTSTTTSRIRVSEPQSVASQPGNFSDRSDFSISGTQASTFVIMITARKDPTASADPARLAVVIETT
eukprot:2376252-Rhodomonas_salina.4